VLFTHGQDIEAISSLQIFDTKGTGGGFAKSTVGNDTLVFSMPSKAGDPLYISRKIAVEPVDATLETRLYGWPNQYNTGHENAPGYPGSLTTHNGGLTGGSADDPQVYSFRDFTSGTAVSVSNVTFVGCRFQSNSVDYFNVHCTGSNMTFEYCSVTPRTAFYTSPPGAAWPSAAAGQNTTSQVPDVNCINGNQGYQYGINIPSGGPVTIKNCDIWGFGNAVVFYNTTARMICENTWIHDAADADPQNYHTDGPGYLNGGTGPDNVSIIHCTIASLGNTNGLAFQAATSGYDNICIDGNYLSGFGYTVTLSTSENFTNSTFTNNVFGTDIQRYYGPLHSTYALMFGRDNNHWSGNALRVLEGTVKSSASNFTFSEADDGKYMLPDASLSPTDF